MTPGFVDNSCGVVACGMGICQQLPKEGQEHAIKIYMIDLVYRFCDLFYLPPSFHILDLEHTRNKNPICKYTYMQC